MNAEEETLIWKGRPSQWTNLGTYLLCLLLAAGVATIYFTTSLGPIVWVALAVPALLGFSRWLATHYHRYEVTSERVRISTGFFSRRTTELELYRVRDYTLVEPFWLRLIGRGNLVLETSDRSHPRVLLHAVPQASALKDQIRTATETMRQRRGVRDLEIDTP